MHRRRALAALATGVGAVLAGTAIAAGRYRLRAGATMIREYTYAKLRLRADRRGLSAHPMQYLLARPHAGNARMGIISLDGADHDFPWNCGAFVRAVGDRPIVIATPYIVSNGGRRPPSAYPYLASTMAMANRAPLEFDVAGVTALVHELRSMFSLSVLYLSAYSAGGHLGWKLALDAPQLWSGVALACANFAARGLDTEAIGPSQAFPGPIALPIRRFQGALDSRRAILDEQWQAGVALARTRGFTNLTEALVPDAAHSPCARAVIDWCSAARSMP